MNISPGARLGPYEILAQAGAGGMGEVWKARDTRLDRNVAIKVLPQEFASNAQLRGRFEREAKTISQLDHPNICTLFDVGDDYLVMEFLEGETLADRIARGPLSLAEVSRIGAQIASALEKAHRAGIVHRDLKPGNIMLTKSGAKLLDFGLARSTPSSTPNDATQHKPLTREGTILGTYQYMSPEQLAGDEADARSDIFSFGAVLYEMVTGHRAFDGKTKTSLIAAIIGSEPRPLSQLQPLTPAALEHVIAKCLAKEPDDRWQSAADIASELEWIGRSSGLTTTTAITRRRVTRKRFLLTALALSVATAIAVTIVAMSLARRLTIAERPIRSEITLAGADLSEVVFGSIALSPDGSRLLMATGRGGAERAIVIRDLMSGETKPLPGTGNASFPFWSPDGQSIGCFIEGKLKSISLTGGGTQIICDARQGRGGSWSPEGVIVFAPDLSSGLFKVSEGGGTPVPVTKAEPEWTHRNPFFLRDGKHFLFVGRKTAEMPAGAIYAGSIDATPTKLVVENGSNPVVVGNWLLFARNRNLVAMRFDSKTMTVSGAPLPIAENVDFYAPRDYANFSANETSLVYVNATTRPRQLAVADLNGKLLSEIGPAGQYDLLDMSPDEKRMAVAEVDASQKDVWLMEADRGVLSRATFTNSPEVSCVFSPDGSKIAYTSTASAARATITIQSLDGTTKETILTSSHPVYLQDWSKDGQYLIFVEQLPGTGFDINAISTRDRKIIPVVKTPFNETGCTLSPNGKWLAYSSNESGTGQTYVTTFPPTGVKWQATIRSGSFPRWSRDGRKLFFVAQGLNVVDVREGPTPSFGIPRPLSFPFDVRLVRGVAVNFEPMTNDRLLIVKPIGPEPLRPVHLVTNWMKLLRR